MNMGGPTEPAKVKPFLNRLFTDQDIIDLGGGYFQKALAKVIAYRRTPKITSQYEQIGMSPSYRITKAQGDTLQSLLNDKHPDLDFKSYVMFRYTDPLTTDVLKQMKSDGIEHAIAFPQYPMWSCTTSGSSMNELWRNLKALDMEKTFRWSVIDRWNLHDRLQERFDRPFQQLS